MNARAVASRDLDARPRSEATVSATNAQRLELRIGGMTCAHCPPAIEKAIAAVAGVSVAQVNPATKIARIDYDPSRTKIASILQAVRAIGYTVGTATARIPIRNMHCSSCVIRVELALQMTPGVVSARASLGPNAVDIEYQPEKVDFDAIRKAIAAAGYRARRAEDRCDQ